MMVWKLVIGQMKYSIIFLAVTEFPEHYYFSLEEAWQQHCTTEVPGYLQRRTAAFRQRERAAPDAHTFKPLSIPALMGLLKSNIHINAAAWKSFDHQKDRLPKAAHSRLLSEMEKATHEDIPVSLRDYLEAGRLEEEAALPQNEMSAAVVGPSAMEVELPSKEKRFQSLWADLSRKGTGDSCRSGIAGWLQGVYDNGDYRQHSQKNGCRDLSLTVFMNSGSC